MQLAHFLRADPHIWAAQICLIGLPSLQVCESRSQHALRTSAAEQLLNDEHHDIVAAILQTHPVLISGWPLLRQLVAVPTALQLALLRVHVAANGGVCELDIGATAGLPSVLPLLPHVPELTSVSLRVLRRPKKQARGRIASLAAVMSALEGVRHLASIEMHASVCRETLASMPSLSSMTALRQLSFARIDGHGDAGIKRALATAPALAGLKLSYECGVGTRAVHKMAALLASAASCLTSLEVVCARSLSKAQAEPTAACFAQLRSLVELRIDTSYDYDAARVFAALISAPTALQAFELRCSPRCRNKWGAQSGELILQRLSQMPSLTSLTLSGHFLSESGMTALAQYLQGFARLRRVQFDLDHLPNLTVAGHLTGLSRLTELVVLVKDGWSALKMPDTRSNETRDGEGAARTWHDLRRRVAAASRVQSLHQVTADSSAELTDLLTGLGSLTSLNLMLISRRATVAHGTFSHLTQLRRLEYSFDGDLTSVLPSLQMLTHLRLAQCGPSSDPKAMWASLVVSLPQLPQLVQLELRICFSTHAAVRLGPALAALPRLRRLQLSKCALCNHDIAALVPYLSRLTQLQTLSFKANCLKDEVARDLCVHLAPLVAMGLTLVDLRLNMFHRPACVVTALGVAVAKVTAMDGVSVTV